MDFAEWKSGWRPAGRHLTEVCWFGMVVFGGCVAYEPFPQDPVVILRELESEVFSREDLAGPQSQGLTARQAAGWAVTHNKSLLALRAEMGVAEAELVRAGLLPDPVVGIDFADALAAELTGGTATRTEFLSGLGLSWRIPRPGEIGSRVGVAKARKEGVRRTILFAEWSMVRRVHDAFLSIAAARLRLELNAQVLAVAQRTADFFVGAREVGGATAIQANLAATELATLEQDQVRLEGDLREVRLTFNELLGLPPQADLPLDTSEVPFQSQDKAVNVDALVERAVEERPDLMSLMALYQAAEQNLRLEISRQWPGLAIGTGIAIVLPVFSAFNRPVIRAALARRGRIALELRAAVHALRAEVYRAVTALENARREVKAFEDSLLPRLQKSLKLADEAIAVREVTLVEILTAQRQVLEARTNYLEARIRRARAQLMVDTVSGAVLTDRSEGTKQAAEAEEDGKS